MKKKKAAPQWIKNTTCPPDNKTKRFDARLNMASSETKIVVLRSYRHLLKVCAGGSSACLSKSLFCFTFPAMHAHFHTRTPHSFNTYFIYLYIYLPLPLSFSLFFSLFLFCFVFLSPSRQAAAFTFAGDTPRLASAFQTARSYYVKFAGLTDASDIRRMAAEGEDAAVFLRSSIVQGSYDTQSKRMTVKVKPEHTKPFASPNSTAGRESSSSSTYTPITKESSPEHMPPPPISTPSAPTGKR
jgi:hypothetical protein